MMEVHLGMISLYFIEMFHVSVIIFHFSLPFLFKQTIFVVFKSAY
eukprot:UN20321